MLGNWDHPRSRGVYAPRTGRPLVDYGSSPLARGLHGGGVGNVPTPRIIPARAGFTTSQAGQRRGRADHPRSRGVYGPQRHRAPGTRGSSPLARGLLGRHARETNQAGIIPARAGFTLRHCPGSGLTADHPRSRGVYPRRRSPSTPGPGSSPLARGLRADRRRPGGGPRIIPARAGFTTRCSSPATRSPDHPRSRGVYMRGGIEIVM